MSKKTGDSVRPVANGGHGKPKRTIFILYVPGGAMLGVIPLAIMARLKQLTETPITELFQVFDGVSTGSIPTGGLNIRNPDQPCRPKLTEEEALQLFCEHSQAFFPEIANRYVKMITSNIVHVMHDAFDPLRQDELPINDIEKLCNIVAAQTGATFDVAILRATATKKWLARRDKASVLKMCDALRASHPEMTDEARKISELVHVRHATNNLERAFRTTVLSGLDLIGQHWANSYLFDPEIPRRSFQEVFGDQRMSDCLRSTYITTYDKTNRRAHTFYCRKEDLFSTAPDNPSVTNPGNHKVWDAVLSSIANPFAYPPHRTEDGLICSDKATIHTPLYCVSDIMSHKPADATVKLVILGTGKHLSSDQEKRDQIEYNVNFGVLGNLLQGKELEELNAYTMSQMRQSLIETLGVENIIEISPHLTPHSYAESLELPSRNPFDASDGNIHKLLKTAHALQIEDDEQIRKLAFMLIDNLHNLGQMPDAKFRLISERLGVKVPEPERTADIETSRPFDGIPAATHLLKNAWDRLLSPIKRQAANENSTMDKPAKRWLPFGRQ